MKYFKMIWISIVILPWNRIQQELKKQGLHDNENCKYGNR